MTHYITLQIVNKFNFTIIGARFKNMTLSWVVRFVPIPTPDCDSCSITPHHITQNVCFNYVQCGVFVMPGLFVPNNMLLESTIETARASRSTHESMEYSWNIYIPVRFACLF